MTRPPNPSGSVLLRPEPSGRRTLGHGVTLDELEGGDDEPCVGFDRARGGGVGGVRAGVSDSSDRGDPGPPHHDSCGRPTSSSVPGTPDNRIVNSLIPRTDMALTKGPVRPWTPPTSGGTGTPKPHRPSGGVPGTDPPPSPCIQTSLPRSPSFSCKEQDVSGKGFHFTYTRLPPGTELQSHPPSYEWSGREESTGSYVPRPGVKRCGPCDWSVSTRKEVEGEDVSHQGLLGSSPVSPRSPSTVEGDSS